MGALDHVHALARYMENAGAVAWSTSCDRGPNGEIDFCFRVIGLECSEIAAAVRRERVGPPKPFRYRGRGRSR